MEEELTLRIILENPTTGVIFGLQKGKGNNYETVQKQTSKGENLSFELKIRVKCADNKVPVFLGPFAQGTPVDRFIYIDIGTYAGQVGSEWSRRFGSQSHSGKYTNGSQAGSNFRQCRGLHVPEPSHRDVSRLG